MSSGDSTNPTSKLQPTTNAAGSKGANATATAAEANKKPATLEEDDEFEDFPVEDWGEEETEAAAGNTHLWEESWDDDDENEDFSKVLKEELQKVKNSKQ